jgi:hypothetical protein
MLEIAYRNLDDALVDLRDKQATRQNFFMTGKVPVPNRGRAKIVFVPDMDGDFDIRGITASVVAPTDIYGRRMTPENGITDFPIALRTWNDDPVGPPRSNYAERGLILRIYDGKSDLMLSDPEPDMTLNQNAGNGTSPFPPETAPFFNHLLDVKTFFQPGYRLGAFSQPIPFRYYLPRENKLVFEFQNLDTAIGSDNGDPETFFPQYHTVTIVLSGRKIEMDTK